MNLITQQIVKEALKHVGVKEVGHNDGPEVGAWLARVKRLPGAPWCVAFAWCMLDDACRALGKANPLPRVAGTHLLMQMARERKAFTTEPGPGFLFGIDHGKDKHGYRLGHCGIVIGYLPDAGTLETVEGNTNEAGSREGNAVAVKHRKASDITIGYLDPGKLFA